MSRPWNVCLHEAGHAFVAWYFGLEVERVWVRTFAEYDSDPAGDRGCVKAQDFLIHPYLREDVIARGEDYENEISPGATARYEMKLVSCYAGVGAEVGYTGQPLAAGSGEGDLRLVKDMLDRWFRGPEAALAESQAKERIRALLQFHGARRAIIDIAQALCEEGEVDGTQVERLCTTAYPGQVPDLRKWLNIWPPTPEQLRSGFIP